MNFSTLKLNYSGPIASLTLNRPEALNALNGQVLKELALALNEIEQHKELRALILTGAGEKAFVAGADIKEMAAFTREDALTFAETGQALFQRIEDLPIPSIAAVNGFALGGGLELAMSCDIMLASTKAKVGLPEVSLGLIPGFGGTQRLTRFVGKSLARMIALSGDIFPAEKAYQWGLFAEVLAPEELLPRAEKLAQSLASRSPSAIRLAKQAINKGIDESQLSGLKLEARLFAETFVTQDHVEGIKAFIEKRPPLFTGK